MSLPKKVGVRNYYIYLSVTAWLSVLPCPAPTMPIDNFEARKCKAIVEMEKDGLLERILKRRQWHYRLTEAQILKSIEVIKYKTANYTWWPSYDQKIEQIKKLILEYNRNHVPGSDGRTSLEVQQIAKIITEFRLDMPKSQESRVDLAQRIVEDLKGPGFRYANIEHFLFDQTKHPGLLVRDPGPNVIYYSEGRLETLNELVKRHEGTALWLSQLEALIKSGLSGIKSEKEIHDRINAIEHELLSEKITPNQKYYDSLRSDLRRLIKAKRIAAQFRDIGKTPN